MKIICLVLLIVVSCFGQTPGTVTQSTTSNVVGVASTVSCVLSNTTPVLPSGVHVVCTVSGANALTMDSVIPASNPNGLVGSFTNAGNTVTWLVNQLAGQSNYSWQMVANGVSKTGTF